MSEDMEIKEKSLETEVTRPFIELPFYWQNRAEE